MKMTYGIGEAQGASPGTSKHLPLFDGKLLANLFEISDAVVSCVVTKISEGETLATTSLIDEDDFVGLRIKELSHLPPDKPQENQW